MNLCYLERRSRYNSDAQNYPSFFLLIAPFLNQEHPSYSPANLKGVKPLREPAPQTRHIPLHLYRRFYDCNCRATGQNRTTPFSAGDTIHLRRCTPWCNTSRKVFPLSRQSIISGLISGFGFGVGCILIYLALPHVRAGKLTFLIALEVVIVPLICLIYYRQKITRTEKLALIPAVSGLWLITGNAESAFSWWEIVVLMSAFAYSIYTISLSHSPLTANVFSRSFVSFLAIGLFSLCISLMVEPIAAIIWTSSAIIAFLYLVTVGSFTRFLLQAWAQKQVSASFTALMFSAEPVFAITLSYFLLGERFSLLQTLGAISILAALVLANLPLLSDRTVE